MDYQDIVKKSNMLCIIRCGFSWTLVLFIRFKRCGFRIALYRRMGRFLGSHRYLYYGQAGAVEDQIPLKQID